MTVRTAEPESKARSTTILPGRFAFKRSSQRVREPNQYEHVAVTMAQSRAAELESASDQQLRDLAFVLRETNERLGTRLPDKNRQTQWIVGSALVSEAIQRTHGLRYHDTQILAGLTLASSHIAEMATGEGKTIVCAIPAFLAWVEGRQTHVATQNPFLARRDFQRLQPVLERLGCSVSLLPENPENDDWPAKQQAYQADVVYGTGQAFALDHLRDQQTVRAESRWKTATIRFNPLHELSRRSSAVLQRNRDQAVVDEVDSVLIDDAHSFLTLNDNESSGLKLPVLRITRQSFYQMYGSLSGLTGSAEGADEELAEFYRLKTILIPRHKPCRRMDLPDRFFASRDAKLRAIVSEILERHRCGQPVLVGTRTAHDSEMLSDMLRSLKLSHQVLRGSQDAVEAAIVAAAGRYKSVTIATNMAGRGTDIQPDERALAVGGLFVIGVERHDTRRDDRQLAGRAGRRGDFGFSRFFVSGDDDLIQRHAPKLAARLRRTAGKDGEVHDDYSPIITQFQHLSEQQGFARRRKMVEQDRSLDSVLASVLSDADF